ncbi:hypothetical protein GSI_11684 [Ganoderma sinense ZZ0214-1]|uniref:Extracellular membrane protein CFEM domain-containing protein n=1 Tax=Ganoderma sinense ZZ0214-1 TaxID=1077348 RepID=A0A2G8RWN8_9APHY|nr:hypothetical protein GSI_11684 [Ganoderma sinense ZZ0214-1]
MIRSPFALLLAIFAFLAGHVLAELNITIDGRNITAAVFLNSTDSVRTSSQCNQLCNDAQSTIITCNGNNTCLCKNASSPILGCEQCMFSQLIALNRRPTDDLAGQTSSLTGKISFNLLLSFQTNISPSATAYTTACSDANETVSTPLTLVLPDGWDGPFGQGLTIGTTVIAVGSAFIIGVFSIGIVNSM